jgi:hypothetical protein
MYRAVCVYGENGQEVSPEQGGDISEEMKRP